MKANHRLAGRPGMNWHRVRRWGRPALTIVLSLLLVATPILDALPPGLSVAFADPGTYCRVTPSTFNPYEDGYATISWDYYNEHPTEITLEQNGQVLAVLGTGTYGVGDHTKTWNGTIRGQIAPEGTYRICVTPTDEWSEWGKCASVRIVHPPAPSAPTITSYPQETGVRQIRVGGSAAPNLSIQVYLNGHLAGTASSDAQGSWKAYVNLPEEENARHALQARARDPRTGKVSGLSGTAFVHFSLVYYEREGYDGKEVASEFGPNTASGTHSDPVNTSTGNFTHSRLDLMLPGHPQLEWSRHYNSLDRVPGIMGVGWRTSLTQRFQKTADGAVIVFREDGRRDYFRRDEDGVYRAGPGVFDELTFNPDGSAVLKAERDHSRLFFHADGRLDRIEDRNGRTVNLEYQQVGSKHRLVKVENSSGRWLSFSYNSQGLLDEVSDSAERSVSYQYSVAGDLVRVTDPRGSVTAYQYNAAHQITAIGDGDGHILLGNEYDSSERVARQTDADGYTTTFTYHLTERNTIITEPNGQQITDQFDEYYRLVRRVDAAGRATEYGYDDFGHRSRFDLPGDRQVRREYSAEGRLLRLVDAAGNWTSFNYNEAGDLVEMVGPRGNSTHFRYDENHNLVAVELAGGATTSFAYDQRGNLLTRTDPLGNTTRFSYNHRDELISMTDPLGRVTAFSYDDAGRLTGLEEPGDRVTTLQYDAAGNLLSVTRPTGATISYDYDQRGRPLALTDGEGNTTRYRFDHRNLLRAVEDPLGREIAFSYDALGNLTSRVDKAGFITRFEYDALGQLVKLVDPLGAATTLTYNEAGDLVQRMLPEGQVEAWSYDNLGQVVAYTDPTGAVVHLDYDAAGNLTAVTDPLGRSTLRQYDELNRLIGITNPLGEKESFNYDSAGQLVSWFGRAGQSYQYGYDPLGRLVTVTDPAGFITEFDYGAGQLPTALTDPLGNTWRFSYNGDDQLTARFDPLGNATRFDYNHNGQVKAKTDPLGNVTQFSYDPLGNLQQVVDALGHATNHQYDPRGLLAAVQLANGATQDYNYDGNRRLVAETDPLGQITSYHYNANGWLIREVKAGGQAIDYRWDDAQRLVEIAAPDETVTYRYDATGNRVEMTDENGATAYTYDQLNRLTSVTGPWDETIQYSYNPWDQVAELIYPGGEAVTYHYNQRGLLSSVTDWQGETTNYTYNPAGWLSTQSLPNGVSSKCQYTAAGQVSSITHESPLGGVLSRFQYDYDARGLRTSMVETFTGKDPETIQYGYDPLGQLTSALFSDDFQIDYVYDSTGNRISRTEAKADGLKELTTYDYNRASQLLSSTTTSEGQVVAWAQYLYDQNGRLEEETRWGERPEEGREGGAPQGLPVGRDTGVGGDEGEDKTEETDEDEDEDKAGDEPDQLTYSWSARGSLLAVYQDEHHWVSYGYDGDGVRIWREALWIRGVNPEDLPKGQPEGIPGHFDKEDEIGARIDGGDILVTIASKGGAVDRPTPPSQATGGSAGSSDEATSDGGTADDGGVEDDGATEGDSGSSSAPGQTVRDRARDFASTRGRALAPGLKMLNQEPEYTRYLVDKNRRVSQVLQEVHGRPGEEATYTSFLYGLGRIGYQPPIETASMFYYLNDALGSVRQIADQSAAAVHQYSYSPFGVPRGGYLNHPKQQVSEAVSYNPYGFTGERHDTALGLVHLRTRDYQPEIGRFVKPDIFPGLLAQPLTLNRYGYVSNNPINLVDPLGLVGERSSFSDQLKAIPAESLERLNKATSYAGGILGFAGLVLGVAAGVAATPVVVGLLTAVTVAGAAATLLNMGVVGAQWYRGDISSEKAIPALVVGGLALATAGAGIAAGMAVQSGWSGAVSGIVEEGAGWLALSRSWSLFGAFYTANASRNNVTGLLRAVPEI